MSYTGIYIPRKSCFLQVKYSRSADVYIQAQVKDGS